MDLAVGVGRYFVEERDAWNRIESNRGKALFKNCTQYVGTFELTCVTNCVCRRASVFYRNACWPTNCCLLQAGSVSAGLGVCSIQQSEVLLFELSCLFRFSRPTPLALPPRKLTRSVLSYPPVCLPVCPLLSSPLLPYPLPQRKKGARAVPFRTGSEVHVDQRCKAGPVPLPRGARLGPIQTGPEDARPQLLHGRVLHLPGTYVKVGGGGATKEAAFK